MDMKAYGSGQEPNIRALAEGFRKWFERVKDDPEEEARYQAWRKEYYERKEGKRC